jgi:hypothetical protein
MVRASAAVSRVQASSAGAGDAAAGALLEAADPAVTVTVPGARGASTEHPVSATSTVAPASDAVAARCMLAM